MITSEGVIALAHPMNLAPARSGMLLTALPPTPLATQTPRATPQMTFDSELHSLCATDQAMRRTEALHLTPSEGGYMKSELRLQTKSSASGDTAVSLPLSVPWRHQQKQRDEMASGLRDRTGSRTTTKAKPDHTQKKDVLL